MDAQDRRAPLIGALAGAGVLALLVAGIAVARRPGSEPPPRVVAADPERRSDAALTAAARIRGWQIAPAELFAPPGDAVAPFEQRMRPKGPYDAVDAAVLDAEDVRLRLADAVPVPRDEVCADDAGHRFGCGLMSRAALQNHLRGREIACDRAFGPAVRSGGMVEVRCWVDGEDLAERQIALGWAFASWHASERYRAAEALARSRRAGVWAGPHERPDGDPARRDAATIGFGTLRLPPVDPAAGPITAGPIAADPVAGGPVAAGEDRKP